MVEWKLRVSRGSEMVGGTVWISGTVKLEAGRQKERYPPHARWLWRVSLASTAPRQIHAYSSLDQRCQDYHAACPGRHQTIACW